MYKLVKACLILSMFSFLCFGIALIVISYLPFDQLSAVKAFLDSFASDGSFWLFTIKHVVYLRFTAILICIFLGLAYALSRLVRQYISDTGISDLLINPKNTAGMILDLFRGVSGVLKKIEPADFIISPKKIAVLLSAFADDFKNAVKKEDKVHIYSFFLLLVIAVVVRIFYLFQPMISDETMIFEPRINHAHGLMGLIQLISRIDIPGDHIFQTFLSYLTYKSIGSERCVWIIRIPDLIAGILVVPAVYTAVRIFYNKHAALLTSGIIAGSSLLISYSTKARGYSIICLVFFLILALGTYLRNNNKLAAWHLFALLSALGFYTFPLMLLPYGLVIVWLILSIVFKDTDIERIYLFKNLFVSIVITVFLMFLLYSPVIFWGTGLKSFFAHSRITSASWIFFSKGIVFNIVDIWGKYWTRNIPDLINVVFVAGFFTSLLFHKKLSPYRINIVLPASVWLITFL